MSGKLIKQKLGKTGLELTLLGYGAMEIRGSRIWDGRPVTDKQAESILNAVLDGGINFIDTANDYGRSEEFIGKFLSKRRKEFYIATKCGCTVVKKDEKTDDTPHFWTRENLFRGLNESLKRMKTDYIDIMQLHNPTLEQVEENQCIDALLEMKKQGKVRHIGISTTLPHLPKYLKMGIWEVFQIPYSALDREHENWIAESSKAGIGTIIRGGVARGEPNVGYCLRFEDKWKKFEEAKLDELRGEGESRTGFLLRFVMSHPHIHTIIAGTLIPKHLKENIQISFKGPLTLEIYNEAKRRLEEVGVKPATTTDVKS